MNKIILLSLVAIIGLGLGQSVLADSSVLSVLPATLNSAVGTTFNASVQLNPANNKVCVVKGTLSFTNLICQSISVASGLAVQTAPTCASPNFILGIPKCTTAVQNIISTSVKGTGAGQANLSVTGVKVIGVGVNVASAAQGGTYSITSVPAPVVTPKVTPKVTVTPQPVPVTQPAQLSQQTVQPVVTPVSQPTTTSNRNIAANGGPAGFAAIASPYFWPLVIILIILGLGYGVYYILRKKPKK